MKDIDALVSAFMGSYDFDISAPIIDSASKALLFDMNNGLESKLILDGSPEMIPTWVSPHIHKPINKKVIVIDAGGTNFRSFLVEFDNTGKANILKSSKTTMPAIDREYSKKEFFDKIAEYLEHVRDEAKQINFTFSYAVQILSNNDGKVLRFSKEIKANSVVGSLLGEGLIQALKARGWTKVNRVCILNDTTAALLSGMLIENKQYSSYIGIILGTGLNVAYVEKNSIPKLGSLDKVPQIVVTEIGKSNKLPASKFDRILHTEVSDGEICKLEKMCSGAYLGHLISIAIRCACKESIFSIAFSNLFQKADYGFAEINMFMCNENLAENPIHKNIQSLNNIESDVYKQDIQILRKIISCILERVSRIVASLLVAACLKSNEGKDPNKPICIVAEGTTFNKGFGLKDNIQKILYENLTVTHGIHFEIHQIDNSITLGTAVCMGNE